MSSCCPRGRNRRVLILWCSCRAALAVTSSIPTLLISGEFDPVTPPPGGDEVLRTLRADVTSSFVTMAIRLEALTNGISGMIGQLIDSGTTTRVNVSCAASIPAVPFALEDSRQ